jgi:galactokinase
MRSMTPAALDPIDRARDAFVQRHGRDPDGVAFAPGRVNVIGEHTDYNDGFVLPMALQHGVAAAFARRDDGQLVVSAMETGETRAIAVDAVRRATPRVSGWFAYAAGMAACMTDVGSRLGGITVVTASDLPSGAGLSSSAAFELAVGRALAAASGIIWDPQAMARAAQRAEHEFVGVACGIMDQMAAACATAGHALLLDCRSLEIHHVPLPASIAIVVMHSGVKRALAGSAYNDRRAACERAAAAVRQFAPAVQSLRDVDRGLLERARSSIDDVAFRRAMHVVDEMARPHAFAAAIARGDVDAAGRLMIASHASLRDLYEVSCRELDELVDAALAQPGCHGARLTGAGFGGCAIALVDASAVDRFAAALPTAYATRTGLETHVIRARASAGARLA